MQTSRLDYELPDEAIAQQPAPQRDEAALLVDRGPCAAADHARVRDLPDLLEPGDVVVMNATRVLRARLALRKETGGAAEVLLLSPAGAEQNRWHALVRPGRRLRPGTRLTPRDDPDPQSPAHGFAVVVGPEVGGGRREVRIEGVTDLHAAVEAVGEVPLPPYITGEGVDPQRYQTVFASSESPGPLTGSVAAPTAGLHLSHEVIRRCRARGAVVSEIFLDVGLGTFQPVATEVLEDHEMHAEAYLVPEATRRACESARGRVVAIGTTSVRALETWAATGSEGGHTDLFITPGYRFEVVDALLTNFHLPRSSLLGLLEAFMGPRWRDLYTEALASGYRFASFGDAMFTQRTPEAAP